MSEKASRKKWLRAIELAESIANDERILEGDIDCLKDGTRRKRLKNKMRRAKNNPLAIELLPQARKIIRQKMAREEALESTTIGQLRETLTDHVLYDLDSDETLYSTNEIDNLLLEGKVEMEKVLDKFSQDLKKGDLNVCLRHLSSLLDWAILDIQNTDLPSVSEYIYPHRPRATSTSRYIN